MGLLRTAARAAVAASVVGNVQRRQQTRWAAQDAARAQPVAPTHEVPPAPMPQSPPPAAAAQSGTQVMIDQLTKLGQLRDAGVLTPEEFETQKQRLLAAD